MSNSTRTNQQLAQALRTTRKATLAPGVVRASAAGKALQSVGQSSAIAVQDAADYLRNVSTISTTAIGVAMSLLLATGDKKYIKVIKEAGTLMKDATSHFEAIGLAAAKVLRSFPSS